MQIGPKLKNQIHELGKHQESLMQEWMPDGQDLMDPVVDQRP